jgi:hypothetical protein
MMHLKSVFKNLLILTAPGILLVSSGYLDKPGNIIQIDVNGLLNCRPVTTLTKGVFVKWGTGVDKQNGYLTKSAAELNKDDPEHALPDDPLIPANARHPAILLHYNNDEGAKYQARYLVDTGSFTIKVPRYKYNGLYLCFTSAYGATPVQFDLIYKDGTEVKNFKVPDWANDIPETDPDFCYAVHNMAKWGSTNKLTEKDHHNIDALNIHPDPKRVLTAVKVKKLSTTYLLFWAAAGVKAG